MGTPDLSKEDKMWKNKEQNAVKYCYQILSDVFNSNNDVEIREFAIEQEFIVKILDRIQQITKEFKRYYDKN